jgi:D-alanine-D-alanine ligase
MLILKSGLNREIIMRKNKIRIAILFGGRSAEHEVSLQSARNVIEAIDKDRYETVLIGIDRKGGWFLNENWMTLLHSNDPQLIALNQSNTAVSLVPGDETGRLIDLQHSTLIVSIDVVFPILHGPYGEDGSVQGLAKLANVPCVGSDILGSAIGMDKDVAKRLLRDACISVASHICVKRRDLSDELPKQIEQGFGYPVYVKPANMGSSVGVVKVSQAADLLPAIDIALQYDTKILIEESIIGREIECAVLGNDEPIVSTAGEIVTNDGFYSYEKKYIDNEAAKLKIPAALDPACLASLQATAIETFRVLETRGMARVDMFLTANNRIFVNEINTIPGFTAISMYPKLWQASGIPYPELIDRLIRLSIEDFEEKRNLKTTGH